VKIKRDSIFWRVKIQRYIFFLFYRSSLLSFVAQGINKAEPGESRNENKKETCYALSL